MGVMRAALLGLGLLVSGAALAEAPAQLASTPLSRTDLPWWKARLEAKAAELRKGPVDLVFYGDSITQDWEQAGPPKWRNFAPIWQHYYGGRHAINLGFKGDTTAHLLWRIEHGEAAGISPRVAVILIGANNFGKLRWPAGPTEAGIARIVEELRARLPRTRLVVLGVLPSIRNAWVDAQTAALNAALARRFADRRDAIFLDLGDVLRSHGQVDPARFLDPHLNPPDPPLHPSAQAQAALAAALEPSLAALLGDAPRGRP